MGCPYPLPESNKSGVWAHSILVCETSMGVRRGQHPHPKPGTHATPPPRLRPHPAPHPCPAHAPPCAHAPTTPMPRAHAPPTPCPHPAHAVPCAPCPVPPSCTHALPRPAPTPRSQGSAVSGDLVLDGGTPCLGVTLSPRPKQGGHECHLVLWDPGAHRDPPPQGLVGVRRDPGPRTQGKEGVGPPRPG